MRLIDADILERSLTEIDEHINMDIFTNEVRELIDKAPTVDAVPREIVRRIIDSPRNKQQMLDILDSLPKIGE